MNSTVTIKQINKYQITMDGKVLGDFTRGEEWQGMVSFSNSSGTIIVDLDTSNKFGNDLRILLGPGESITRNIIKISPNFV